MQETPDLQVFGRIKNSTCRCSAEKKLDLQVFG